MIRAGQHSTFYMPFRDEGGGDLMRVLLLGITAFLNTFIKSSVLNTGPELDTYLHQKQSKALGDGHKPSNDEGFGNSPTNHDKIDGNVIPFALSPSSPLAFRVPPRSRPLPSRSQPDGGGGENLFLDDISHPLSLPLSRESRSRPSLSLSLSLSRWSRSRGDLDLTRPEALLSSRRTLSMEEGLFEPEETFWRVGNRDTCVSVRIRELEDVEDSLRAIAKPRSRWAIASVVRYRCRWANRLIGGSIDSDLKCIQNYKPQNYVPLG